MGGVLEDYKVMSIALSQKVKTKVVLTLIHTTMLGTVPEHRALVVDTFSYKHGWEGAPAVSLLSCRDNSGAQFSPHTTKMRKIIAHRS